MNRMLVVVFDNETAAEAGARAMRHLESEGAVTLYALGVIAKGADGKVSVKQVAEQIGVGTVFGLAVGSLMGLLAGPVGLAVGAATGTLVGAVRDYWVAGVGLDFVEEAEAFLKPGKVALVAEVEEDWIIPVDSAMAAVGGVVIRRARAEIAQAQFDQDMDAMKAEITALEAEYEHASGAAKISLQGKLAAAKASLDGATQRAKHKLGEFKLEAEAKIKSLDAQIAKAQGDTKSRLEARIKQLRGAYEVRSTKLKEAWGLTKEALTA
jgi:uncharacterized membrane protein